MNKRNNHQSPANIPQGCAFTQQSTNTKQFRELVEEISVLLTYEAFKDIPTVSVSVETPLETAVQQTIAENSVAIVPILRAGLGMVNGVHTLFPTAKVGHIGMYRDEETCTPRHIALLMYPVS